jgi:hypothetical protein
MEPEVSLPCLLEPSTGAYPEPDQSSPYYPILIQFVFISYVFMVYLLALSIA